VVSELQRLVDNLGSRLHRSVAIDDLNIRLLCYSSHAGEVDEERMHWVMHRAAPKKVVDHYRRIGVFEEVDLFTRPVRPDLGLRIERIVMPIRHDGVLLGFLVLLASDGPLTEDEEGLVRQAAAHAAVILHRELLIDELRQARVGQQLRDLLSGDGSDRRDAAQRLVEEDLFVAGPVTALVVSAPRRSGQLLNDKERTALTVGLERGCRHAPPRHAIHLTRADHGVVLFAHPASSGRELESFARAIQADVCKSYGCTAEECYVGIGGQRANLVDVSRSYLEARDAAEAARTIRILGTIVGHTQLGIYGLLTQMSADDLSRTMHAGLRRLLDYDADTGTLATTLEVYLKNAGDVPRTAAQLSLHRASVYYRLRRIEEIAGVDLSDGDDRLALDLGLKVVRILGFRADEDG
jgi:DNA-binding PucR family transcriptional regulator